MQGRIRRFVVLALLFTSSGWGEPKENVEPAAIAKQLDALVPKIREQKKLAGLAACESEAEVWLQEPGDKVVDASHLPLVASVLGRSSSSSACSSKVFRRAKECF